MLALPPFRAVAPGGVATTGQRYLPVAVGLPGPPLTTTVTVNACAAVMLNAEGVIVTVGVSSFTVTVAVPVPDLYTESPL